MKYLICLCTIMAALGASAQNIIGLDDKTNIPSYKLEVSWHKTTLLIFPAPIKNADRGDSYVLAESVKDVNNMLKVKAGQKGFEQSNLSVVTADGKVYSFTVTYNEDAPCLPVDMGKQPPYAPVTFKGVSLNSRQLETYGARVAGSVPFLSGGGYHKHGMDFGLDGVFIKDDVLFFLLHLKNETQIRYDIASLRFYIRDKSSIKRTASQDKEVQPIYAKYNGTPESGKGQVIVVAFPKFTISEKKRLAIEMMEQDGDRNPACALDQKKLLKARPL